MQSPPMDSAQELQIESFLLFVLYLHIYEKRKEMCFFYSLILLEKIRLDLLENHVENSYQVFLSNTTVEEVNQAYHKSFEQGKKEGFVPVLVISDSILLDTLEILEEPSYSKEALLQQCKTLNAIFILTSLRIAFTYLLTYIS